MADCQVDYEDDSFDQAFGTERCGHWQIEAITDVQPDCDLHERVVEALHARGLTNHNRRFKKRVRHTVRQILRYIEQSDPETLFSDSDKEAATERGSVDLEPDFDLDEAA